MVSCLSRRRESIGWRLFANLLAMPIHLLYSLALIGSVPDFPGISNIFSFKVQSGSVLASDDSQIEVRVGFFGMCVVQSSFTNCHPTAGQSTAEIMNLFTVPGQNDQVAIFSNIRSIAFDLQGKIAFPLLAFAGASLFVGHALMLIYKLRLMKKSPGPGPGQSMKAFMFTLILFSIASVFATTLIFSALRSNIVGLDPNLAILVKGGIALLALQWTILALSLLFAMGVYMLFTGIGTRPGGMRNASGPPLGFGAGFPAPPPPPPPPPPPMMQISPCSNSFVHCTSAIRSFRPCGSDSRLRTSVEKPKKTSEMFCGPRDCLRRKP